MPDKYDPFAGDWEKQRLCDNVVTALRAFGPRWPITAEAIDAVAAAFVKAGMVDYLNSDLTAAFTACVENHRKAFTQWATAKAQAEDK